MEREIRIVNKLGLHVRAATKLVQLASEFSADINITYEDQTADAKSIMDVLMLAAIYDTVIKIRVEGDSEEEEQIALDQLSQLIDNRFDENE